MLLTSTAWALLPASGGASSHAGFEAGDLLELDEASTLHGSLTVTQEAYRGGHGARAAYTGNGANGYARGLFHVEWKPGDTVRYSTAFKLPAGFYRSQQGQVALLRWDNWPTYGDAADAGGVVIYGSDHRARLVRSRYNGEQIALGRSFRLPTGQWFQLTVEQRLSQAHPRSRVKVNGRTVASSREQNFYGRAIERIRFGLVAIAAGEQTRPLSLLFDEADATDA
jgi:hypothetical protein